MESRENVNRIRLTFLNGRRKEQNYNSKKLSPFNAREKAVFLIFQKNLQALGDVEKKFLAGKGVQG